ncbi:MAG: hypothetical protein A2284_16525 [Deltaproteobacteria bacterium RIFOXYA12_FULL_61_11]|nr:MAG: hypothetical protein A2284_16525 [Deltaproteobacteria bacterium RIFOXYA12_FULL_61_11]
MQRYESLYDFVNLLLERNVDLPTMHRDLWDSFGQTCAVVVLDLENLREDTRELGLTSYLGQLVALRTTLMSICEHFSCKEMHTTESGFQGAFASVTKAFEAITAANTILRTNSTTEATTPLGLRFAIGHGRVLVSPIDGIIGEEMTTAGHLVRDFARNGEVLLSERAFADLEFRLRPSFLKMSRQFMGVQHQYYLGRL